MKHNINKILIINLSNIGDCILTLPSIDLIKGNFPNAKITMLIGPKASPLFDRDSRIDNLIIYDKRKPFTDKITLTFRLRKIGFNMIFDLRHTAFPLFLRARYKSHILRSRTNERIHRRDMYLAMAKRMYPFKAKSALPAHIAYLHSDEDCVTNLLKENGIGSSDKFIVVSAGAASHEKRWTKEGFIELSQRLIKEFALRIVFVGDETDSVISEEIVRALKNKAINLCGKTSLKQLALVLHKCQLLISNDSAVMHMGCYLDIPVLAIFGHTDPAKYGPWNNKSRLVREEIIFDKPNNNRAYKLEFMRALSPEKVFSVAQAMLKPKMHHRQTDYRYKRILITRTDRIGDVVLSTPAIRALSDYYPNAFIAVMVRPYALDIVEGNPYIDEVIIYDKFGIHKKFLNTIKFALSLRKRKFDLAIMLHPTNRAHIISFIAGIRERIGYDRKFPFLLTKKIPHIKQLGEKHESEYALDVIRSLGFKLENADLFMPIKEESEAYIEGILRKFGYSNSQKLIAIHPGASCPSKRWMPQRFAEVSNKLVEKYNAKIAIIASKDDLKTAHFVINAMRYPVIDLSGRTTVSELASLLKRCSLFISNDSGPVHISSAVGTPVVSIFGRKQAGLSPKRWGPLGKNDKIIHKDVHCPQCLAHNCQKDFLCLKAVSVSEVMECVDELSRLW